MPEAFVPRSTVDPGLITLPPATADHRLRWDLRKLQATLNDNRQERHLSWAELAGQLACTPNRLTNLKTAKLADLALVMAVTQWLERPSSDFIYAASW